MYIIADNPAGTGPAQVKEGLEKLDFLVVQDMFMTETARLADVVLPSASFAEKDGTFTNTERKVQRVRKAIDPPDEAKEDWRIFRDVARALGQTMAYNSAEDIMEEIVKMVPQYAGINYERLENDGIHCPSSAEGSGTLRLHVGKFSCGQGKFQAVEYTPPAEAPDTRYPMYLTTGRTLYQFHGGTDESKASLGRSAEPYVEVSVEDAIACQVGDGDSIKVTSKQGEVQLKALISDKAMKGTLFIPHPFAVPLDPTAETLAHHVCAVKIEKA